MLTIPGELAGRYEAMLDRRSIAPGHRVHYRKWLRFYLDFCQKYAFDAASSDSLPQFEKRAEGEGTGRFAAPTSAARGVPVLRSDR
jgi:hypothetical protein